MTMSNIGKILLVDDVYDDVIKRALTALIEEGMPVQFWNGKGDFPDMIRNVRVVILDLDLTGVGTRSPGPEFYYPAAEALNKIPGPFLVIIMAIDFNEDDPSGLDSYYREHYGPLCGFIVERGLSKDEELEDPSRLQKLIVSSIAKKKILNLILLWEAVVDRAKDRSLSDLVAKEIENTVSALIKSLCKDFGEEAASRELVNVMMRLVSRRIGGCEEINSLNELIKEINAELLQKTTEYPGKDDTLLYNRLMFYEPGPGETVWTGDIFRTSRVSKYDKYAIVLTPACDLVHGKTTRVLTCFAFPLDEKCFEDPEYPPNKIDSVVVKKLKEGAKPSDILKKRYLLRKGKLPANFHILWNFRDRNKTFGVCFDFNNVRTIEIAKLRKWKRVCRLDSPFVEEILEKYGRLVSRIGTLDINRSPEQLRTSIYKINGSS